MRNWDREKFAHGQWAVRYTVRSIVILLSVMASRKRCRPDEGPSGEKRPRLHEHESSESGSSSSHETASCSSEEADSDSFFDWSVFESSDEHNSDTSGSDSNDSQLEGDDCFEVEETPFAATMVKKLEHTVRERCLVARWACSCIVGLASL